MTDKAARTYMDSGILVVDDEPVMCSFVKEALLSAGYKKIFSASGGIDCLDVLKARGEEIQLILLDIKMPDLGGMSVIEHLVNSHDHIVGIIGISGYERPPAFETSGSETILTLDYMSKPFEFDDLLSRVETALELVRKKQYRIRTSFEEGYSENSTGYKSG